MSIRQATTTGFPFLWCTLVIDHVTKVIFGLLLIRMLLDEVVFVWQLQDDGEKPEKWEHHVRMQSPGEMLNILDMSLKQRRLRIFSFEVTGELGNVVDLNVVKPDVFLSSMSTPAVIIGRYI